MPPIISEVDHNGSSAFELTFQFESRKLLPFRRPHEIGTSTISNKCENKRKQQDCCQRELQSSGFSKSGYYLVPSGITSVLSERRNQFADERRSEVKYQTLSITSNATNQLAGLLRFGSTSCYHACVNYVESSDPCPIQCHSRGKQSK